MQDARRGGFTLIELLVSIAIIALLIGITLPALLNTRVGSREMLSLSNARQVAISFEMYSDARRTYPFPGDVGFTPGEDGMSVNWYPLGSIVATSSIWNASVLWPGLLSAEASWEENFETWVSPGLSTELPEGWLESEGEIEPLEVVSYEYSNSFLARPNLWLRDVSSTPPSNPRSLVSPCRADEVVFPSQKVLLWDRHLAYRSGELEVEGGHWAAPTPMAFADQHAAVHLPQDARPGAINPLNAGDTRTLHNTPDGFAGFDF